jgi:hypothetical protein
MTRRGKEDMKRCRKGEAVLIAASYLVVKIFNTHAMPLSLLVIWITEVLHVFILLASLHPLG